MFVWALASLGISGWLHRRWREVAGAAAIGTIALALLVLGQGRLYELPRTVQRSLAFLPGKWSEVVIADAESSSTWRFQLWKDVIDQGLIKDWWLGDGFGANLQDLLATLHASSYTDFATLTGSYHSGPLTAIRFVGIIGLVLLYVLTISAAWYAYQCVNECRGTILFPVAVFMAIQLIWWPIHYTFVFGGYDGYLPDTIFQIAILRLLIRLSEQMKEQALARARTPEATLPSAAGVSA
jgi:hypothetical protein